MTATTPEVLCGSEHCITCGDDGVPMTVLRVDGRRGLALCADRAGNRSTVETALVEPVGPGAELLVHAGTAIATLSATTTSQTTTAATAAAGDPR